MAKNRNQPIHKETAQKHTKTTGKAENLKKQD